MNHAYLIMAHHQIELLLVLLTLIDDERNDIYLHVDKKWKDFDFLACKKAVRHANVYMIKRRSVTWGGYSQIQLELDLLKEATKKVYAFYHLLSGVDLPIKNQNYIHNFFDNHSNTEFVSFDYNQNISNFSNRIDQYIFLQEIYGNKKNFFYDLDSLLIVLQKKCGIHRISQFPLTLKKGANWFSVTDDFARFVIKHEQEIQKYFRYSRCCDELFLQTVASSSDFINRIYFDKTENRNYNMRYVDFQRGNPYVFQYSDLPMLQQRKELFARKFDWNKDKDVILQLRDYILGEE